MVHVTSGGGERRKEKGEIWSSFPPFFFPQGDYDFPTCGGKEAKQGFHFRFSQITKCEKKNKSCFLLSCLSPSIDRGVFRHFSPFSIFQGKSKCCPLQGKKKNFEGKINEASYCTEKSLPFSSSASAKNQFRFFGTTHGFPNSRHKTFAEKRTCSFSCWGNQAMTMTPKLWFSRKERLEGATFYVFLFRKKGKEMSFFPRKKKIFHSLPRKRRRRSRKNRNVVGVWGPDPCP